MRHLFAIAAVMLALSGNALAEEESVVEQSARADWSMGAGLGFGGYIYLPASSISPTIVGSGLGTLGLGSSLPAAIGAPSGSLFFERRLARRWWAVGRATFSYSSDTYDNDQALAPSSYYQKSLENHGGQGSLSFGLRSVVGSWSRVEVSAFALLGGGGSWGSGVTTVAHSDSNGQVTNVRSLGDTKSWSAGVVGGFIVDVFLLQNLGLRFSSSLLSASYGAASGTWKNDPAEPNAKPVTAKSSGFNAGIYLSPSLELRVLF